MGTVDRYNSYSALQSSRRGHATNHQSSCDHDHYSTRLTRRLRVYRIHTVLDLVEREVLGERADMLVSMSIQLPPYSIRTVSFSTIMAPPWNGCASKVSMDLSRWSKGGQRKGSSRVRGRRRRTYRAARLLRSESNVL
jgi:hypothetical protein